MLTVVEGRVLGCLLEKERTTPDQYPLTPNALLLACNQSTAREPVMALDAHDVEAAIASLKTQGLARLVHPSHGRSVTRCRQVADEHHGWGTAQTALIAVLVLRGPQTTAELRARTERQHAFADIEAVESTLRTLVEGELVVQLERAPGEREPRWQQLLAEEPEPVARRAVAGHIQPRSASRSDEAAERIDALEARVARLEAALADLLA
ncbi:MAG: hypothetical protein JWM34_678 [Ilumatobacteraceae bacterium]|nr:hypothetical protein [Ilumatobacteraceae bacterium]